MSADLLLRVRHLRTVLDAPGGPLPVVDDVSFDLEKGKVLGIVGESGSGKTMLVLSLLGLLPGRARVESGEILLGGQNLTGLSEREFGAVRGRRIGMVFQEPLTSFDPLYTVGDQIAEGLRRHLGLDRRQARVRSVELLDAVGIARASQVYDSYPFQLSGGMRQRALIAMALGPEPELLIADEPTTALDVTIQAQILTLLKDLQRDRGIGVLFVSHNLGVIAEVADEVMVLYGGQVMERSGIDALFDRPAHPYTRALLEARPSLSGEVTRLRSVPGQVPSLDGRPSGCPFHPRCSRATAACTVNRPVLVGSGGGQAAACWNLATGGHP